MQKRNVDFPLKVLFNNSNSGKLTMIYDLQALKIKYKEYSNLYQKIKIECKNKTLFKIKRGLYTDDLESDREIIANICYSPSYISFEYALSYYGLIPEHVSLFTSAVFNKKNNKIYFAEGAAFEYRSIPNNVYPEGITFVDNGHGMKYKIASKEKALCDLLYSKYPVRTKKELCILLFDDLRIDPNELQNLDLTYMEEIMPLYKSNTLNTFLKYGKEIIYGKRN